MGTSRRGSSDASSRAARSQKRAERHEPGHFEFRCDLCSLVFAESEMRTQHGLRLCASCYEPAGDEIDRDLHRAWASKRAAMRTAQRRLSAYPYSYESLPGIEEMLPVRLDRPYIFNVGGEPFTLSAVGPAVTFAVTGTDLGDATFTFPPGVFVLESSTSEDGTLYSAVLAAGPSATLGPNPVLVGTEAGTSPWWGKIIVGEAIMPDLNNVFLRLDGDNNDHPESLDWLTRAEAVLSFNGRMGVVVPASGDYTGSQVANVPAGNIAATDVQAAINELDSSITSLGVINVKDYGAIGDGVTDDGAAITAAAAALSAQGGGTLLFPPGEYLLFDSAGGTIVALSGLTGVSILGYGATLAISTTNAAILTTTSYGAIFSLTNSKNILIDGFDVTGPDMSATFGGSSKGIDVVKLYPGTDGVSIPNMRAQGVQSGVIYLGSLADALKRNVWVGNLTVSQSYYGIAGYYGIDGLGVENLVTDDVYRSFFLYGGVYNVRANIESTNTGGRDVILETTLLTTGAGAGLENIHLKYVNKGSTASGSDPCIRLGWGSSNPAKIKNVKIDLDIEFAASGTTPSSAVEIVKFQTGGATPDTTDRGHTLSGLRISGTVSGTPSTPDADTIWCDPSARWGASLDAWYGLELRDLRLLTGSINIDAAAVRDGVMLKGVYASGDIAISSYAAPTTNLSKKLFVDGVVCNNVAALSYFDIAYSAGIFTGNGSMTWTVDEADVTALWYSVKGKIVTLHFDLTTTTVGGTLNNSLRIQVPAAITPARSTLNQCYGVQGSTIETYSVRAVSGSANIVIQRPGAVNYASSTDGTIVRGQISYPVA